jgi:hypothetical protein
MKDQTGIRSDVDGSIQAQSPWKLLILQQKADLGKRYAISVQLERNLQRQRG